MVKMMENNHKSIHEKAIRLIEGGIVEVSGLCVKAKQVYCDSDPCFVCEMDCLCHKGNPICDLCEECDSITDEHYYLILVS